MKVILASRSPRRRELLLQLYPEFEVMSLDVDETLPLGVDIGEGTAVARLVGGEALVISSDTLVERDGVALGKPKDERDAHRMLRSLSGREHNVHTGVAVHYRGRVLSGTAVSRVSFRELTDSEILEYISTGEPMDKAGAYGIQGLGGRFVSGYTGDFDTIMGLSVSLTGRLCEEITKDDKD